MKKEILTTKEAAAELGIKPATLEQWRWRGCGPKFCKVGRVCRYRRSDLEEFLAGSTFSSTGHAASR